LPGERIGRSDLCSELTSIFPTSSAIGPFRVASRAA
jgi:hypothetical protein